jgi:ectoine hydroxylase-related dioxygenase (phytanoyl-CoA dioxygenase family)
VLSGGQLQSRGFAILPGFIAEAELGVVRQLVEECLATLLAPGCERPNNTLLPLRWDHPLVSTILGSDARVSSVASVSAAKDLRWISGYVSVKEPRSSPLWWHQDWWCWDHSSSFLDAPVQIAVLCYLTDTSIRTGALRVLPGTHRRTHALHACLPAAHAEEVALPADHAAMADHRDQASLEAFAGDAVVIDYRLLHGTHPNTSTSRRDCLLFSFAPSWSLLPDDLRAHLIRHPAQPQPHEPVPASRRLLPHYDGTRRDLRLNRVPPSRFTVTP